MQVTLTVEEAGVYELMDALSSMAERMRRDVSMGIPGAEFYMEQLRLRLRTVRALEGQIEQAVALAGDPRCL